MRTQRVQDSRGGLSGALRSWYHALRQGNPHWLLTPSPVRWTRFELLGYLDYCRQRVRDTLTGMTDEQAATSLPQVHRSSGLPHAWIITASVGHTIEYAAQIRQLITAARMASSEE